MTTEKPTPTPAEHGYVVTMEFETREAGEKYLAAIKRLGELRDYKLAAEAEADAGDEARAKNAALVREVEGLREQLPPEESWTCDEVTVTTCRADGSFLVRINDGRIEGGTEVRFLHRHVALVVRNANRHRDRAERAEQERDIALESKYEFRCKACQYLFKGHNRICPECFSNDNDRVRDMDVFGQLQRAEQELAAVVAALDSVFIQHKADCPDCGGTGDGRTNANDEILPCDTCHGHARTSQKLSTLERVQKLIEQRDLFSRFTPDAQSQLSSAHALLTEAGVPVEREAKTPDEWVVSNPFKIPLPDRVQALVGQRDEREAFAASARALFTRIRTVCEIKTKSHMSYSGKRYEKAIDQLLARSVFGVTAIENARKAFDELQLLWRLGSCAEKEFDALAEKIPETVDHANPDDYRAWCIAGVRRKAIKERDALRAQLAQVTAERDLAIISANSMKAAWHAACHDIAVSESPDDSDEITREWLESLGWEQMFSDVPIWWHREISYAQVNFRDGPQLRMGSPSHGWSLLGSTKGHLRRYCIGVGHPIDAHPQPAAASETPHKESA